MLKNKSLILKFIKALRTQYYVAGVHILDCFDMYLGFLKEYATPILSEMTQWQYEDMRMCIWNDKIDYDRVPLETVWNKNRRSGKTRDATKLAVFFSIMGYDCIWRTPMSTQLKMSYKWFLHNPFVEKIRTMEHMIIVHDSPYIDIAVLRPGNCTGIEGNVILFDEGGWVRKGYQVYEGYKQGRPMIASVDFKHIIHFSTPARDTAFSEVWDTVADIERKLGTKLKVKRVVDDCHWITPEFVESERKANFDCPWYIDQNYYGIFVVYGGAVFETPIDIRLSPKEIQEHWNNTISNIGGVDFNMPKNGHYLVTGNCFDNYTFIREELNFRDLSFLKEYMDKHPELHIEIEDGGFNLQFVNECYTLGINANYIAWREESKMIRVHKLQSVPVYIDKEKCKLTFLNMQEAGYDQGSRLPRLEKRTGQHGVDCALHLVGVVCNNKIYYGRIKRDTNINPFKKNTYELGYIE